MTNGNKYIRYPLFFATIGLVFSFIVMVGTFLNNGVNKVTEDVVHIKEDVIEIKTDIKWIVEYMREGSTIGAAGEFIPDDAVYAPEPTVYDPAIQPVYKEPLASKVKPIHPDEAVLKVLEELGIPTTTVSQ